MPSLPLNFTFIDFQLNVYIQADDVVRDDGTEFVYGPIQIRLTVTKWPVKLQEGLHNLGIWGTREHHLGLARHRGSLVSLFKFRMFQITVIQDLSR